jgi:hypothetical protein
MPWRRTNAAERESGGVMERAISGSGFQGVDPPVLVLDGREGQSHLLADRAGKESAQGMRLPAGGLK